MAEIDVGQQKKLRVYYLANNMDKGDLFLSLLNADNIGGSECFTDGCKDVAYLRHYIGEPDLVPLCRTCAEQWEVDCGTTGCEYRARFTFSENQDLEEERIIDLCSECADIFFDKITRDHIEHRMANVNG